MKDSLATVVKNAGSHYVLSPLPEWAPFPAVLRGRVRLKGSTATNPVAVGDLVRYEMDADKAQITEILPRRNYLIRRSTNLSRQAHIIAATWTGLFSSSPCIFRRSNFPSWTVCWSPVKYTASIPSSSCRKWTSTGTRRRRK